MGTIQGQLTDEQFRAEYPNAQINNRDRTAVIRYGKNTYNYWMQHPDGSWTNYDCRTV